jgi:hypothetical protein
VAPGLFGAALRQTYPGKTARGFSPELEALAGISGVRATPYEPAEAQATALYEARNTLQSRRSDLNEQGVYETNATPEYRRILRDLSKVETQLDTLNKRRLKVYKGRPTTPEPSKSGLPWGGSAMPSGPTKGRLPWG